MIEPPGYLEFNHFVKRARAVITDSGGITEGTDELLGADPESIDPAMEKLFSGKWKIGGKPENWDRHAAERIIGALLDEILPSQTENAEFAYVNPDKLENWIAVLAHNHLITKHLNKPPSHYKNQD